MQCDESIGLNQMGEKEMSAGGGGSLEVGAVLLLCLLWICLFL